MNAEVSNNVRVMVMCAECGAHLDFEIGRTLNDSHGFFLKLKPCPECSKDPGAVVARHFKALTEEVKRLKEALGMKA